MAAPAAWVSEQRACTLVREQRLSGQMEGAEDSDKLAWAHPQRHAFLHHIAADVDADLPRQHGRQHGQVGVVRLAGPELRSSRATAV